MNYRRFVLASLFASLVAPVVPAHAYFLASRGTDAGGEPIPIKWTSTPIEYRIQSDAAGFQGGEAFAEAVRAAFQTWNDVACLTGLEFVEAAARDETPTPQPWTTNMRYVNVFFIRETDPVTLGNSVGTGAFGWDDNTIIAGTIYLNTFGFEWSTDESEGTMDVQGVVTGLIGRMMGIESRDVEASTHPVFSPVGSPFPSNSLEKRTLEGDDIAAVQFLYGTDCGDVMEPEDVCPDPNLQPFANCPPAISSDDFEFADADARPQSDSGGTTTPRPDSGSGDGGGDDGGDEGCDCATVGVRSRSFPVSAAIIVAGLFALALRRRRPRG